MFKDVNTMTKRELVDELEKHMTLVPNRKAFERSLKKDLVWLIERVRADRK